MIRKKQQMTAIEWCFNHTMVIIRDFDLLWCEHSDYATQSSRLDNCLTTSRALDVAAAAAVG